MKMNDKEKEFMYQAYVKEDCKLELYKSSGANEPGFIFKGSQNSLVMMIRKLFISVLQNEILSGNDLRKLLNASIEEYEGDKNESK